jgi:hypothetical protein
MVVLKVIVLPLITCRRPFLPHLYSTERQISYIGIGISCCHRSRVRISSRHSGGTYRCSLQRNSDKNKKSSEYLEESTVIGTKIIFLYFL